MKKALSIIIALFWAISAEAQVCCQAGNEAACCATKGKKWCADEGACRTKCLSEMCPPGYAFDMEIMTCKKVTQEPETESEGEITEFDLCAGVVCTGCNACNPENGQCETTCATGQQCDGNGNCVACDPSAAANDQSLCEACNWEWTISVFGGPDDNPTNPSYSCGGDAFCKASTGSETAVWYGKRHMSMTQCIRKAYSCCASGNLVAYDCGRGEEWTGYECR